MLDVAVWSSWHNSNITTWSEHTGNHLRIKTECLHINIHITYIIDYAITLLCLCVTCETNWECYCFPSTHFRSTIVHGLQTGSMESMLALIKLFNTGRLSFFTIFRFISEWGDIAELFKTYCTVLQWRSFNGRYINFTNLVSAVKCEVEVKVIKGKVWIWAKWPIRQELIPVSIAWSC